MKISKKLVTATLAVCLILLAGYLLLQLSKSRTFQFFGHITSHIITNKKVVALTFDDAPTQYTDDVLGILQKKEVKGTFYVIGQNAEKFSDKMKDIIAGGHELGNHSYSHQRMVFKSQKFIHDEIEKTNTLIRDAGYAGEITFRPPNGKKFLSLPWYLSNHNIKNIMWDVEPDTYFSGNADAIAKYTIENTKPGSIVLMHPFCKDECLADREALPKIIDELRAEGYSFVTISQLDRYEKR
jgi:peptidoglycan/xylan/chitin deacetylase (PgdA/CDA1 family)